MGAIDRYLANPYRLKAIASRLLCDHRRKKTIKKIKKWYYDVSKLSLLNVIKPVDHFRYRSFPSFYWEENDICSIVNATPEEQFKETVERADFFVKGLFSFRGSKEVSFAGSLDWNYHIPDLPEWHRDLHRLDWLNQILLAGHYTGGSNYFAFAAEQIIDWHKCNPPESSTWSDPFEVSQRINTLCWILYLGRANDAFSDAAVESVVATICASANLTNNLLEFHSPNNHLLIGSLRLAQAGLMFPEFPGSNEWIVKGHTLLLKEIKRQILPDGVHAERSIFYHRLILEALLEWIMLAKKNRHFYSHIFDEKCLKMLTFLSDIQRPDFEFPQFGDGFRNDTFVRFKPFAIGSFLYHHSGSDPSLNINTRWLLAGKSKKRKDLQHIIKSKVYDDGGYAIIRQDDKSKKSHLVFDCGQFGMKAAPSHGHAGCLSLELFSQNRSMLVNSGTYSFAHDLSVRNAFRGTSAHNTVIIDGQDQTELQGFFGAGNYIEPTVSLSLFGKSCALIEAEHSNYRRLSGDILHRRTILELSPSIYVVIDRIAGSGIHNARALWHFHPDLTSKISDDSCLAIDKDNRGISVRWFGSTSLTSEILRGEESPMIGWVSFDTGKKLEADVVSLTADSEFPLNIVTVLETFTDRPVASVLNTRIDNQTVAIKIDGPDVKSEIYISNTEETSGFGRLKSDAGLYTLTELDNGRCIALANGKKLYNNNALLLELTSPTAGILLEQHDSNLSISGDLSDRLMFYDLTIDTASINGKNVKVNKTARCIEILPLS